MRAVFPATSVQVIPNFPLSISESFAQIVFPVLLLQLRIASTFDTPLAKPATAAQHLAPHLMCVVCTC